MVDPSQAPISQIGDALDSLAATIHERRNAGEESYTYRLLHGDLEKLLKKVVEESFEVAMAAKDVQHLVAQVVNDEATAAGSSEVASGIHAEAHGETSDAEANAAHREAGVDALALAVEEAAADAALDHFRYEVGDVIYHVLVLLERAGISLDELAAELNSRMTDEALEARPGALQLYPEHLNRGK